MFVDLVFIKVIIPFVAFVFALLLSIIAYFLRSLHKDFITKITDQEQRLDIIEDNINIISKDIVYIKTKVNI